MSIKASVIALFLYTFLTGILTYPLFFNLNKGIFGYKGDNMLYMHDIWVWSQNKIPNLGEIKYSVISTQPILDQTAVLISKITKSPLISYNILIIFSFISAGFLTYIFAYKITQNHLASFIAGLIFSFSPYHMRQAQNHLEIAQIEVIPFYFLFLYNFSKSCTKKSAVITGLALAIATLTVNYYGLFLGILSAIYILYNEIVKRFKGLKKRLLSYLILFTVSIILVAGCNVNYIKIASQNKNLDEFTWKALGKTDLDYVKYAAKPWFYLLPDIQNPVLGQLSRNALIKLAQYTPYYLTREFTANEHLLYLGIIPITLAGIALRFKFKISKKFILIALIFILISFPPYIFISMKKIILPSFLLMKIFPMFRVYSRAGAIAILLISLVSAIGMSALTLNPKKKLRAFFISSVAAILILTEFYVPSRFEKLLPLPPEYSSIKVKEAKTILESPKLEDHTNTFYQIYHQKPIFFVRINSRNRVDINDLEMQIRLREEPMAIIFRGNYKPIFQEHKLNERGLDLQNPNIEGTALFSQEHIRWLNENEKIIESVHGNVKILNYGETYLFFHSN